MRRLTSILFLCVSLAVAVSLTAQQPQCPTCPIYPVNAKYLDGAGMGYAPTAGAGLVLNLAAGRNRCANTMTNYAGGTLTLANNTTNYVYLDTTASCAPASNTSGYTSAGLTIATVVTSGGAITTITDDRVFGLSTAAGSGLSSTLNSAHIFVGNASNVATDIALTGDVSITNAGVSTVAHGLSFSIGIPGGTALTSGSTTTDYLTVPFACTISAYNLNIDAGTITVKFWKVATGTAIPTSGNSISTSGVGISSGTAIHSTTVSDFTTTSVAANDIMAMNVTAVSTAAYVNGVLKCN